MEVDWVALVKLLPVLFWPVTASLVLWLFGVKGRTVKSDKDVQYRGRTYDVGGEG